MKQTRPILITMIFFVSACSAPNTAAPNELSPAPTIQNATAPAPITVPVINTRTDRRAPTLAPTATATLILPTEIPTATEMTSQTPTLIPTNTALPSPTNARPNATATSQLVAGVYVTRFQMDPAAPKSKPAEFFFTVSFLNTVGENVNYSRWRVLIFPKGQTNAIGDPRGISKTIANGTSQQITEAWSIKVTSVCESFLAQPVWENEDGKQTPVPQPDGKNLTLEFQVCP